jgi:hypothetical protein
MKWLLSIVNITIPLLVFSGLAQTPPIDREYTLESTMLGYRGVGGDIDGIRNPPLWARSGENVRITIVNGELMVHDLTLEKHNVRTAQILDKGATSSVTFKAKESDVYFCSVPGHRAAGMEGRFEVSDQPIVQSPGVVPLMNGHPLNLDFESGTLDNWTATGDAFALVKEDTQRQAQRGAVAGAYWVSSGVNGNARKGTLSSAPFRVTYPYASFLVSGGAFASTRVELVLAADNTVIDTISGADQAVFRPAVVDLQQYAGQDIFIRLVDEESGAPTAAYLRESPWAHINFDDFRFHEKRPFFAERDRALGRQHDATDGCAPACGLVGSGGRQSDESAARFLGDARRIRARYREADRVHHGRPRTVVGCGSAHVSGARVGRSGP